MPGPPPKPPAQRRRRNKGVGRLKLPAVSGRTVPELPGASETALEYWATIWQSPMAAVWLEADEPGLARLAHLVDAFTAGDASAVILSEIRQLEDRYGLTPLARRRLQWEL